MVSAHRPVFSTGESGFLSVYGRRKKATEAAKPRRRRAASRPAFACAISSFR
jgi:hypothetical protein